MSDGPTLPPPGWYPDPSGSPVQRYWDGTAWTAGEAPTATAPQRPPRNGFGIAALILGIIGVLTGIIPFFFWLAAILGIIGLILGFVGRGRAKRGEATNGAMALWGIITSAVAVVLSVVGLVILVGAFERLDEDPSGTEATVSPTAENPVSPPAETSAPAHTEETAPTVAEDVEVSKLEVGDCLAESQETEEFFSVPTLPCSEPHSDEVFAVVNLPEGDGDFPGLETIDAQADELCIAKFEGFVGLSYEESVLDFGFITPTEESWNDGDRFVICTIYDPTELVSGSLRGAER